MSSPLKDIGFMQVALTTFAKLQANEQKLKADLNIIKQISI